MSLKTTSLCYHFIFLTFLVTTGKVIAQNIVPNPSFEIYTSCPTGIGSGGPLLCMPWQNGSAATADFFHVCSTSSDVSIPTNWFGSQAPLTGDAYTGLIVRWYNDPWREYIQVQLTEPMVAGTLYEVNYYVSCADNYCGIANMGVYISNAPPPSGGVGHLLVTPQLEADLGFLTDKVNWTLITGCYVAEGGEEYITIGNFYDDNDTPLEPGCDGEKSYYYIEDVSVIPLDENTLPLELGAPVIACVSYVIDPDVTDVDYLWSDGSNGPTLTVTESGTYVLTITQHCVHGVDSVEIFFDGVPYDVDLGTEEVVICNGDSYVISLDPDIGDYEWQDGTIGPDYLITTPGLYQVSMNDGCDISTDMINVEVIDIPVFSLGDDAILCPGDEIEFLFDPDLGEFQWQDNSFYAEYYIDKGGYYELTISNMCGEFSDDLVVTEVAPPDVNLGPDQLSFCQGQNMEIILDEDLGEYLWEDGSTSFYYLISSPGIYSVTVTNECGVSSDTIEAIFIDPLSSPDLGTDVSICPGEAYVLYANSPEVTYIWQDSSVADSLIVNSAGTYWLQIANMCSTASDTVVVVINDNPPVIDLPASLQLCDNTFLTIEAAISGVNYLWNDGSTFSSIIVGSPGTYSITVTNACGSDADTVYVTDAGPAPFVELGPDIDICVGDYVHLSPVFSDVNTWLWNDGSNNQTFNIGEAGIISVEVSNNCGDDTDSLTVSLLPDIPPIDLGADTSLCPGESIDLSIDPNGVDILWSNGSTFHDLQVSSPGLVYATITNQCGSASDSVFVNALAAIPLLDLGIDQSLCPGEVITLSPGIPNVNYLWNNGSTATTFNATIAGEIILTISNECGTRSDTIIVVENLEGPQVNLGQDILACEGNIITLSSDISGVDYLWQDGSTLPELTATSSGTFILEVSNSCGQDADTVIVDIMGTVPTPDLGPDTLLCDGVALQLISLADPITSIQWQNGSTLPVFSVTVPGDYILSESNHCGDVSDTISIAYLSPPPTVDLGPDQTLCPGETVTLTAPATTATITWQDGSNGSTFIADQSQIYTLQLSNECGMTSDDFELSIDQRSPQINLNDEYPWCPEDVFSFNVTQSFAAEYLWNDGSALSTIHITKPGLYSVMVMTDCKTVEHELEVHESDSCFMNDHVYVPNVFSPNGDEVNDLFEVIFGSGLDVTSAMCSIYDRWGNLVFGTNSKSIRWDGHYKSKPVNPGVYTYVMHLEYMTNKEERSKVVSGSITLIR